MRSNTRTLTDVNARSLSTPYAVMGVCITLSLISHHVAWFVICRCATITGSCLVWDSGCITILPTTSTRPTTTSNALEDKVGNSVGGKDDNDTNDSGNNGILGFFYLIVVPMRGHPQESAIDHKDKEDHRNHGQSRPYHVSNNNGDRRCVFKSGGVCRLSQPIVVALRKHGNRHGQRKKQTN